MLNNSENKCIFHTNKIAKYESVPASPLGEGFAALFLSFFDSSWPAVKNGYWCSVGEFLLTAVHD